MMYYFDYSATTKTDKKVLERFNEVSQEYFGNANSSYEFARKCKKVIDDTSCIIADYFNVSLDYLFGRETDEPSNKIICRIIVKLFENRYLQSTDYKTKETKWLVNTQYEEGDPLSFVKKTNPVVYKALYLQNYIQDEDPDYQRTGNDIEKNIEINKFIEYYLSLKEMKENGIMDENIFNTSISNYIENMKYWIAYILYIRLILKISDSFYYKKSTNLIVDAFRLFVLILWILVKIIRITVAHPI